MPRTRIFICTLLASIALGASVIDTGQALASHGERVYFEAAGRLLNEKTRARSITEMKALGVDAIRVVLYWREVAPSPTAKAKPKFQATDPEAYDWGAYATLLEEAKELHWQVLLTVSAPAPRWATRSTTEPYVKNPNAEEFGEFMTAVGLEFGSKVSLWAIWNEPNQPFFLQPQFNSEGQPASPRIYRSLFQEGYKGLQKAGLETPKVLMGETAPTGDSHLKNAKTEKERLHDVSPLAFLRGALCLNANYKKSSACASLPAYGFSDHAYTVAAGPYYKPPSGDVMIGVLSRLTEALNRAGAAHAIKQDMDIYITEFGVQSLPNRYYGVSLTKQAEYDALAERIAYENPRVAAFSQYLLRDDPLGGPPGASVHGGRTGFQSGLESVTGVHKPIYKSWPNQLVVLEEGSQYELWGHVRLTKRATKVTILVQRKGSKRFTTLKTVKTTSTGYWSLQSSTTGTYWRVRWTSPAGVRHEGPPIAAYSP